ncbi:putative E3 ubiquitin-protein ligase UBR7 [Biomphalaria glabrata]|uniref:E3 ubiquitin-protein ligase UBR7 n=1 Tax=Biomphalaria glabrata TaxID=6526 RepID=A0A9W2ZV15_BIOGL|nr:putative E3 ubiquitin-protein ligase UBR7 [Biomphalaria glabrata]XP_055878731.1 putative E3 ubiquitin-protein ligase UBR7 [Biomphalaria glabrata]XP_055878732.1 putative E3 ubiquitin-protein ligase UBR7 [Biomphalaria glabrata]XP_055878733.1 putative E3 ubiquitin-protein ligase UBR7 [Biomphalaria glabrata]XP_055878734.1 putative E3 ubiquitin-protein ligase UBR7 [Biomphalaria glabrata]
MAQQNGNSNIRRCGSLVRPSRASLENEEDSDDCVSMDDFLSEQERLQADADAVLGGSDENNCTYPKGYLQRQALYSCSTCTPEGNAGVCLACSYACHEGHELYELYTKRNFSCDCGNEKFTNNPCQLFKAPKGLNARNRYNQNFRGLYCSCSRPYPDPEDKIEDEMIQCILCEDWHHGRHLNVTVPDDFEEMICPSCMSKFSFLWLYASNIKDEVIAKETDNVVVVDEEPATTKEEVDLFVQSQKRSRPEETDKNSLHEAASSKKAKLDDSLGTEVCLLKTLQNTTTDCPDQAVFWKAGWRSKLCRCTSCMDMYKDKTIEFIIDETDTVHSYEEKGRSSSASRASEPVDVTDALKGMNRVQQIEVVQGFLDLKSELNEFLQGFARDQKIVTESDIREFFQRMDSRRKERLHLPQDNCR